MWAAGCQRLMNQEAAVQKAIQEHLSQRSDLAMDKMTMEMRRVTVSGDKAEAEVVFRVTADPNSQLFFHYDLYREGGRWRVQGGRPSGEQSAHPTPGGAPEGGLPPGGMGQPAPGALPEGHPPIGEVNPRQEPPPSPHP